MNLWCGVGRLCRDPEIKYSNSSNDPMAIARFSIAVDRRFKKDGEQNCDFFNCVCFGKLGEFVEKYLHKGTKIVVSGRLENNNYKNKDGQNVYDIRIVAESIEFAESKANDTSKEQKNENKEETWMNVPEGSQEELPFS